MGLATWGSVQPSAIDEVIEACRFAAARGWVPATSGNFSARVDAARIAITASGTDKGALLRQDVLTIMMEAPPIPGSSAETGLHLQAYRRDPGIGAVVHVHTLNATVLSRHLADAGAVVLRGYELLKAFAGIGTHETELVVPVFANSQDMHALADRVAAYAHAAPGYLLAGHGLYAWGRTMREALRHAEAFEFLFGCELAAMRSGL
jgi:methylthioribulose-1-phosphate dehydratase